MPVLGLRLVGISGGLVGLAIAGCGDEGERQGPAAGVPEDITVTSREFENGDPIPERFSCHGENVSPPLEWTGVPDEAQAVALVVDDPDAPDGTYTHWVVVDIPTDTISIATGTPPEGVTQVQNSAGDAAYTGPCPPSGTHHYRFTVYALSEPTGVEEGAELDAGLDAIEEHAVARGTLEGTYAA